MTETTSTQSPNAAPRRGLTKASCRNRCRTCSRPGGKRCRQDFQGLTAAGKVSKRLVSARPTGVSTQPIVAAVKEFLSSLDAEQRAAVSFPVESEVWRHWSNIHRNVMRHGLCLAELSERQLRAGLRHHARGTRCEGLRNRPQRHAAQRASGRAHRAARRIRRDVLLDQYFRYAVAGRLGASRSTAITATSIASCSATRWC